ncbi:MFS transporter [Sphaerisporangium sp. NBC_01403]|uniref:MFS transporter n=1 Tax=Sphaerisporangium sp. NBC_01403 TaxID=2903599 RepID=UPI003243BC7F
MAAQPPETADPVTAEASAPASVLTWIRPVLLIMCAGGVSQGFARFTFAFILPDMTEDVLGSYSVAGLLGAANLGGYLIGVIAMTSLAGRFESTRLLKAGLALTVLGLLIVAVAPWTPLLFAGMGMAGLCSAAVWIPIPSIIAAYAPQRHRGIGFGLATAGIGIAVALTGPLVTLVQRLFGDGEWRQVWAAEVVLSVVILVLQLLFLKPIGTHTAGPSRRGSLRSRLPGASTLLPAQFLYGISYALFTNYLVAALQDDMGFELASATQIFSFLGIASIFGGVVGGRTSDMFGRRFVLAAFMVAIGMVALVIPLRWSDGMYVSAIAYGMLMTAIGTVLVAYLSDVLGPSEIGAAFGSATISLGSAQLIAPPIGGWLADATGSFDLTFYVACGTGVLAGIVAGFLPNTRKGRRP